MVLICKNCSNKERFYRENDMRQYYTETEFIDEFEDAHDWETHDDYDTETIETGTITCCECDSTDVEDVTSDEWEEWEGPESYKPKTWAERYSGKTKDL